MLYVVVLLLTACGSRTEHQTYTIRGSVAPAEFEGDMVMIHATAEGVYDMPLDSGCISDGEFVFEGIAPFEPSLVLFSVVDSDTGTEGVVSGTFVLEPGDIRLDIGDNYMMSVSGTPLNDMNSVCDAADVEYEDTCAKIRDMACGADERRALMSEARRVRNMKMIGALEPNMDCKLAQQLLNSNCTFFNIEELNMLLKGRVGGKKNVTEKYKESVIGQRLGEVYIPDMDSNMVRLGDEFARHDYTLVDFWASWCGPCMRNMVQMKELYREYRGERFEVVAVSLDSDRAKWERAVESVDGGWMEVSYLDGWNCPLASRLRVGFVPTTILFDRDGVIVARNPTAAELEIWLARD